MFPIAGYPAIILLAAVVGLMLWGIRGRGKLIECPECGYQFKRPAFQEKSYGSGLTIPGLGNYTCPKCNYKDSASSFRYVSDSADIQSGRKGQDGIDKKST